MPVAKELKIYKDLQRARTLRTGVANCAASRYDAATLGGHSGHRNHPQAWASRNIEATIKPTPRHPDHIAPGGWEIWTCAKGMANRLMVKLKLLMAPRT